MAARQDQTQTIITIVCAILILLLSIVAYLTWSSSKQEFARAEDLKSQLSNAENLSRKKLNEGEQMLVMMGFEPGAPFEDVQKRFEEDRDAYMSTYGEGAQTYRNVLSSSQTENKTLAQQESVAKNQVKKLEQDLISLQAEYDRQLKEAASKATKANTDLAAERTRFNSERENIERQKRGLTQTIARLEDDFNKRLAEAQTARDTFADESTKKDKTIEKLQAERSTEDPTSELADGRVTYVNQANQTAWIDLGEADSLRRQVTFSVFASDLSDAAKAEKKGSLEVVRLLGDHIAETKITSDDPRDPILPGDRIYSQVWERGKAMRFGLTGLVDLDGDGTSDLQRAKDLIALNGGVVDVSLEEDGQVDGEMTVSTRYLVLGDLPSTPGKAFYRKGYQEMSRLADTLGVEVITLTDFLNRMGYRPAEETFRFTGGAARKSGGARPTSYRFSP